MRRREGGKIPNLPALDSEVCVLNVLLSFYCSYLTRYFFWWGWGSNSAGISKAKEVKKEHFAVDRRCCFSPAAEALNYRTVIYNKSLIHF